MNTLRVIKASKLSLYRQIITLCSEIHRKNVNELVEEWKTSLISFAILFHFLCTQYVSDINISIIRSLRLCCWIATSVVLFSVRCVLKIWCGYVWVVLVLQAEACNTGTTYRRFGETTTRTQRPVTVLYHNSQRNRRVNPKLHSTSAVHITFCSRIQRMRWAEHVARIGERRGVYGVLVWKPEGKRSLRRLRRR